MVQLAKAFVAKPDVRVYSLKDPGWKEKTNA